MHGDSPDTPRTQAIEKLESLGLSAYGARTYVTLVELGGGTARDISEASTVPRPRVYDATDELAEHGLVDVQHSSPQRFRAVSSETVTQYFEATYERHVNVLRTALEGIEPKRSLEEQRGVWTVTGQESVTDRIVEFVDSADEEIVYMTVAEMLTDDLLEALRRASDRGVSIRLAGLSEPVETEIREELPDAELFDSLWSFSETPAGRLLMSDRKRTLVSVRPPTDSERARWGETAIWGSGETNSLVLVLKTMFTWELTNDGEL